MMQTINQIKTLTTLTLAVWRISHMIAWEDGILGLNARLRKLAGVETAWCDSGKYFEHGFSYTNEKTIKYMVELPTHLQPTVLTRGLKCINCVSFWITLLVWFCYQLKPKQTLAFCQPLALNTIVIMLDIYKDK